MPADFLQLAGKRMLVMGVANRKSVAWHVSRVLVEAGAEVVYAVRSEARREQVQQLVGDAAVFVCDVEFEDQIDRLARDLSERFDRLDGFVHSIAFADYAGEPQPFHATSKREFLRAFDISCFSLVAVSNALKDLLAPDASVVTISISTTRMASENYGYMAPIKAALDSSLAFLAKSFSRFSQVRFNAVAPGFAEDLGVGRHSGIRRFLPVCRAGDAQKTGGEDRGSGQRGGVFAQPAVERHQFPAGRRGRRNEHELF